MKIKISSSREFKYLLLSGLRNARSVTNLYHKIIYAYTISLSEQIKYQNMKFDFGDFKCMKISMFFGCRNNIIYSANNANIDIICTLF